MGLVEILQRHSKVTAEHKQHKSTMASFMSHFSGREMTDNQADQYHDMEVKDGDYQKQLDDITKEHNAELKRQQAAGNFKEIKKGESSGGKSKGK